MLLIEYLRLLRRRGWVVVLAALVTAASAFVFSRLQTPVYKSTVYVLVQPSRTDLGLTESTKTLLRSYVAWMDTDRNAAAVIDTLELDRTPQDLRADVQIAEDISRFVIQIDVEDEIGDQANDIARKWAELFVQWRQDENLKVRREDQVDALLLDEPRYALERPQTRVNVAAGGILGALLGGLIVFALEWNDAGVIRSTADVERFLGLSVLGVIPTVEGGAERRKAAAQASAPRTAEAAR
jgi:capsular polysaccharide biosynthesis protein